MLSAGRCRVVRNPGRLGVACPSLRDPLSEKTLLLLPHSAVITRAGRLMRSLRLSP